MHKSQERKGQDVIIVFLNEMINWRIIGMMTQHSFSIFISNIISTKEKKSFARIYFHFIFIIIYC